MRDLQDIRELINPEGITDGKIVAAQARFYDYCKMMNPKFYRDDRPYQRDLCETLQAIFEGRLINKSTGEPYKNLMINLPPRHGKSYTLTLFVQWCMGKKNDTRVISVSYNDILAGRFARNVRDGIDADKIDSKVTIFHDVFPTTRIKQGDAAAQLWSLEGQFFNYLATGFGGTITGIGCSMGIIDDPIKNDQEAFNDRVLDEQWSWYTDTFLSRIEEGGMQIIVMTRWSTKDLCGRLLASEDGGDWFVFCRRACLDEGERRMLCPDLLSWKSYMKKRRLTARRSRTPTTSRSRWTSRASSTASSAPMSSCRATPRGSWTSPRSSATPTRLTPAATTCAASSRASMRARATFWTSL